MGASAGVRVDCGPEVQLLGGRVAVLQGRAALDAYRLVSRGIEAVRRQDGIEPSAGLRELVAVLKAAAAAAAAGSSSEIAEIAELRRGGLARESVRTGELIGVEEVARMRGVGQRQARHLASSLGGWRGAGRGRPWCFDRGLVQAYIDSEISPEAVG